MSLFDSFTGPRWQHSDPEVRKSAVEQLDDPEVLLQLVRTDPDSGVQSAALSRITDPGTLDALIDTLPQALQQQARNQRLKQLLPAADGLGAIDDDAMLVRIINLSDDAELLAAAIERIGSDTVRLELASNHAVAKVRLKAARGIENMALLSELMQRSKGRDKAVFRHCKTRVDEHHARLQAEAERQEKVRQLCEEVNVLASAPDSKDYESHYRVLMAQWRLVKASASQEQLEQFERDQAGCAQRLVHMADTRAAEEQVKAEVAAVSQAFAAIIGELEGIDAASLADDPAAVKQLGQHLDDIEQRWQEAEKITRAAKEQARAYRRQLELWRSISRTLQRINDRASQLNKALAEAESVDAADHHALQRLIGSTAKLLTSLPWPESHSAHLPLQIAQLRQALEQLKSHFSRLEADQAKHIKRLQKWLAALNDDLEKNRSKEAERALVKASRVLKSLAPKQRQQFEQELQPLAARLKEVKDWRNFAVEPKKVELCARMAELIGSEEDVEILAAKISFLQDEWKQLGALPHARDQALWNEFKAAADEAWKPCKKAFAQQARLRRQNFAKRMQVVAQLTEYEEKMAWPSSGKEADDAANSAPAAPPDWKMVQKTLDAARAAFREITPVDQKSDRVSHKAFRGICDRIYRHIKEEYARNITRKEELVGQAQALSAMEEFPQAIEQCKKLQRVWKDVGITPAAVDRKLWKTFRAACDTVFARLDEQRAQHTAEVDALVKQAESLHDQARQLLAAADDEQGLHLNKALAGLKQQLQDIELPPRVQQRLAREFQAMEKQARAMGIEIRRRREQASWVHLLEKMAACALKITDEDAAARQWQAAGELPKGIDTEALESFWQEGPSDGLEEQLREACIALEVLAEIESPAEDKKARMNYQMRRLVTGMGRGKDQPESPLEEHINNFIALRPSSQWAGRFCSVLEKIRS